MSDTPATEFEAKLARLEEIVRQLESVEIGLDQSVALFREGKLISTRCETLLHEAEEMVAKLSEPALDGFA